MTPERAQLFIEEIHQSGWFLSIGPQSVTASHVTFGAAVGRGDKLPDMLDDLRRQLRERELCQ